MEQTECTLPAALTTVWQLNENGLDLGGTDRLFQSYLQPIFG